MLKDIGKRLLRANGFELRRIQTPGGHLRPIGRTVSILEDVRSRGFDPRIAFDVGASDGSWTRMIRPIFSTATVVLVEPRPEVSETLSAMCASNSPCSLVRAAAGASVGTATMTIRDTASTILSVDAKGDQQISVPVVTLDSLASEFGLPDLVKLDIEGFELEALGGATQLFGTTELFIIEVSLFRFEARRPVLQDVVGFMAENGYAVYDVGDFIRRPFDGALSLVDLCFCRTSGPLRRSETAWHSEIR